ncbi:unnamed protein product [Rotaria magnacalcarata]|uniref:Uncharacterized protein n=1 Tax=Rotaria magnacalcarata TaxID=392030 RepID=A0A8S2KIM7_9BILA|nr:unnamed protein product [Rotaria magnacalcarata]
MRINTYGIRSQLKAFADRNTIFGWVEWKQRISVYAEFHCHRTIDLIKQDKSSKSPPHSSLSTPSSSESCSKSAKDLLKRLTTKESRLPFFFIVLCLWLSACVIFERGLIISFETVDNAIPLVYYNCNWGTIPNLQILRSIFTWFHTVAAITTYTLVNLLILISFTRRIHRYVVSSLADFQMDSKYDDCSNASNKQRSGRQRRNLETNMVVWLVVNGNNMHNEFRETINFHEIFDDINECIDYVTHCQSEKIFFILSESVYDAIVPVIHNLAQIHAIYILAENKTLEYPVEQYAKVRGMYNTVHNVHEAIAQEVAVFAGIKDFTISCMPASSSDSISLSNRLEASFMYFQLLIDVLLSINVGNAKQDMINKCRQQYDGNEVQLKTIDDFEKSYTFNTAIQWYTSDTFIYRILNKALRVQDIDTLFKIRFFIKDLHLQLEKLYENDEKKQSGTLVVYRGQLLAADEFEKIRQNIGGFLSINSFMSTTDDRNLALIYSGYGLQRPSNESILFEMTVDQEKCQRPFHHIRALSNFVNENEILFSMGMVCRIQSIEEIAGVWHISLTSNDENDEDLRKLRLHIRQELYDTTDMTPFGQLLSKMGEYDKLVQFYLLMLAEISDDNEKLIMFHSHLGATYNDLRRYEEALIHLKKVTELEAQENSMSCAETFANIGIVYHSMENYPEAMTYMLKAQDIVENHCPQYEAKLSIMYNNIGTVFCQMNDLSNAYLYYEKSLAIKKKILPLNHPSFASTCNNLAEISFKRGDYEDALRQFLEVLDIDLRTLPPYHISLANTYHNIGFTQMEQKNYAQALENITKALDIAKKSNHPDMHEYQKLIDTIASEMIIK